MSSKTTSSPIATKQSHHKLEIVERSLDSLSAHPDNPRVHSPKQVKQIAKSIETFGFKFPVLINEDNQVIAGHGRLLACEDLGITSVPTICVSDLSPEKSRALMIADNKLTENADWDDELLAQNFKILSDLELDFDIDVSGFEYGQIEELVMSVENVELLQDGEIVDEEELNVHDHSVTKLGDVWQLDKHRIICGDALDATSYKTLLSKRKAALIFTDPPYNLSARDIGKVADEVHGDFKQAAGEMTQDEFQTFLDKLFSRLTSYSKQGSIHYVCMDWRHLTEILGAGNQHYHELKNICVWAKDRAGMGSLYRSQHELVLVFKNGKQRHVNNVQLGEYGRYRSNVWSYPSVRSFSSEAGEANANSALLLHPTMKPIKLVEDALLDCSKRNEIVLDAFLGSGTTLLAAENSHRICMGIELEPKYVDVSIRRWQSLRGKEAMHSGSGKTFDELAEELGNE